MKKRPLADIFFDEQDANLFLVEDARLRADALKHSVLPRLRVLMNEAIALILEIYGIEALEDSIVSAYPNFRSRRENELRVLYDSAFVGLGGKRKPQWPGFSRKDGKPVQILPFRFAFVLTRAGIFTILENGLTKGLTNKSLEAMLRSANGHGISRTIRLTDDCFAAMLRFHIDNDSKLNPLYSRSKMRPAVVWDDGHPLLSPLKDQYEFRIEHKMFDSHFGGYCYHLPVTSVQLANIVDDYACFFPVYDSYVRMAKGLPPRLDELIGKLNAWMWNKWDEEVADEKPVSPEPISVDARHHATLVAASKVRVMPAMRWQVFQRDGWKCVACGRTSHDGAILHVDHILPQSRGGSDTLDNYQTLCDTCNIGKSNRDSTDLRKKN